MKKVGFGLMRLPLLNPSDDTRRLLFRLLSVTRDYGGAISEI